jgi:hypothetical protein
MLWTPDSRNPIIPSRHFHGTRSTVQISSGANGPDLISIIVISHFAISRLWGVVAFKLWTPDSRNPEISSHHIHGTRSTVQICSGSNGPDLISLIAISHFAISRLWGVAAFKLWTPDSRNPEISSHHIHGTRSMVQICSGSNGPDLIALIDFDFTFRDFGE